MYETSACALYNIFNYSKNAKMAFLHTLYILTGWKKYKKRHLPPCFNSSWNHLSRIIFVNENGFQKVCIKYQLNTVFPFIYRPTKTKKSFVFLSKRCETFSDLGFPTQFYHIYMYYRWCKCWYMRIRAYAKLVAPLDLWWPGLHVASCCSLAGEHRSRRQKRPAWTSPVF